MYRAQVGEFSTQPYSISYLVLSRNPASNLYPVKNEYCAKNPRDHLVESEDTQKLCCHYGALVATPPEICLPKFALVNSALLFFISNFCDTQSSHVAR